jgi:hypothetical protein
LLPQENQLADVVVLVRSRCSQPGDAERERGALRDAAPIGLLQQLEQERAGLFPADVAECKGGVAPGRDRSLAGGLHERTRVLAVLHRRFGELAQRQQYRHALAWSGHPSSQHREHSFLGTAVVAGVALAEQPRDREGYATLGIHEQVR